MTTLELEIAFMNGFEFNKNLIVPNITASYELLKFETDMLLLSNSGYAHGFELKVSLSDLKKDKSKKQWICCETDEAKAIKLYFEKLKYFSYFVPNYLVDAVENQAPSFCGIYTILSYKDYEDNERTILKEVRKPKMLNKYKFSDKEILKIARLGCMRIYSLKNNIKRLTP